MPYLPTADLSTARLAFLQVTRCAWHDCTHTPARQPDTLRFAILPSHLSDLPLFTIPMHFFQLAQILQIDRHSWLKRFGLFVIPFARSLL